MNPATYCKYLKETLKEERYDTLRNNISKTTNNNLVNLDEETFLKQLKKVYPNNYSAWEIDFTEMINRKKGKRN